MTTLREEIDIELKKHLDKWKYIPPMMEVVDITIKHIEKRIDWLDDFLINYVPEEQRKYIKKEMLK